MYELDKNKTNSNPQKVILLKRNPIEEKELNYKKIYDLSQLDNIPNINPQEKMQLLLSIKALLLSTNDYLDVGNKFELTRYIIFSEVIYILYLLIFVPIYTSYFMKEDQFNSRPNISNFNKFLYYNSIEILEVLFRIIFNYVKRKKVRKTMIFFGKNELRKISEHFIINLNINNYDIYIQRTNMNNYIKYCHENQEINNLQDKYNFYNYVINYPNMRYYNWDKNILNEKEREIINSILSNLNEVEKQYVRKYSFTVFIIWIFYLVCFKALVCNNINSFLMYRFGAFVFTKVFSIFMSMDYRNRLGVKEEILSKNYINQGYFILLNSSVIQVFRLKDNISDSTISVDESFKRIHKDVLDLNEKIKNLD